MLDWMLPPDLPAISSRAATGIRRSSPCAGAAFFAGAAQVITKPGPCALAQGPFFRYRIPTRLRRPAYILAVRTGGNAAALARGARAP